MKYHKDGNKVIKHNFVLLGILLIVFSFFGYLLLKRNNSGYVKSAEIISFTPVESNAVLVNPYMGPAPSASNINPIASSLVFNYVSWRDLELTKGIVDFSSFETKNKFDYWASKNVKIIFRLQMDYPSSVVGHKDIPDWLYNEIGGDGTWYNKAVDGSYGIGFSPNYNNTKLIAYHKELIRKIGERYNNDPRIAFIEIGSLGHWGEFHTYRGTNLKIQFPGTLVSDQYVQPYLDYLGNKKLLMRRVLPITKINNMGLFNDEYGNYDQTYTWWLNRINTPYFDPIIQEQMPAMPDYWKNNIVGGENTYGLINMTTLFPDVLKAAKDIHLSYTKAIFSLTDSATKTNAEIFYKTIGYRFVVQSASINNNLVPGETANINIAINNKGVAPFYYSWPVELSLINSSGLVAYKTNISENIKTWMPGIKTFSTNITIPTTITPGTYSLAIAVIDPEKNTPGIYFANEGRNTDGRYLLGKFNIISSPNSTIIPTNMPTLKPTMVPTSIPTPTPTVKPTVTPIPTAKPTVVIVPTAVPTVVIPTPTPVIIPTTSNYKAEFWNYSYDWLRTFSRLRTPVFTTQVATINFNWGSASPNSRVKADKFMARFTGTQYFEGGQYQFTTTSDDGVRLYVDDKLVIDNWTKHSAQVNNANVYLLSGNHNVRLEYFEYQGLSVIKLDVKK